MCTLSIRFSKCLFSFSALAHFPFDSDNIEITGLSVFLSSRNILPLDACLNESTGHKGVSQGAPGPEPLFEVTVDISC